MTTLWVVNIHYSHAGKIHLNKKEYKRVDILWNSSTMHNYKELNRQSLVKNREHWIIYSEFLFAKSEYVTFQTFFLSLLVEEKDEQDFTHNTNIAF